MKGYSKVAKQKIGELIRKDSFVSIIYIDHEAVDIEFKNTSCRVGIWGRVVWLGVEDKLK